MSTLEQLHGTFSLVWEVSSSTVHYPWKNLYHFHKLTGRSHTLLRKTTSNSSTGLDEVDRSVLSNKSSSLSNLHREDKDRRQYHKRNLHNISEIHSNSENESHIGRRVELKPPISPYERSSRSHSSSKTLKGSKQDVRRPGSRERVLDDRGSSSELRSSKQELSRDAT